MKKIILFSFALILGLATQSQAQSEDYKMNASLSANYTFTGTIFNSLINVAERTSEQVDRKSFPSLQLAFDYGINKNFSLGLAASYQTIGFDAQDVMYIDDEGQSQLENYNLTLTRTSVALRPLFHYANNDRLDMYSGLRLQYFSAGIATDSNNPNRENEFFEETDFTEVNKFALGVTAFGIRYYITENIGIGTEINIGRPYVSNLSINARF